MKRYPVYKDSGIDWLGEIPEHWQRISIREVTKSVAQRSRPDLPLLAVYRDYGVIYRDSRDDNHNTIPQDLSNYKVVKPGNLVLNKMKTWQGSLGVSSFSGIVSPAYIVCEVSTGVNSRFLNYLLRCSRYIFIYNKISYGVRVDQWDMHYEDFKQITIFLPPPEEQKAIAHFIDRKLEQIEQFIRNKKRLIELLNEQKTAIINRAVTKGINPNAPMKHSGIEWLGEIPSHWEVIKLGRLCKVTKLTGFEYTKLWKTDPQGEIIALRGLNIKNNRLIIDDVERISAELSNQLNRSKLFAGDIVFPCTGTLGHGALIEENDKFHINQNIAKITPTESFNSEFLLYVLCCSSMQYQINRLNSSGLQPVLLIGTIRNLIIQIPSKVEQEQIVQWIKRTIAKIDLAIAQVEKEIELIQEYRTTLISDAVTGKIDVRPNLLIETTLTA